MRSLALFVGIIIIGYVASLFLPWWCLALVSAILVFLLIPARFSSLLLASIFGGIVLWGAYALWIDMGNQHLLSRRIGQLLGGLPGLGMILVTAIFGGILSGLGAWLGWATLHLLRPKSVQKFT